MFHGVGAFQDGIVEKIIEISLEQKILLFIFFLQTNQLINIRVQFFTMYQRILFFFAVLNLVSVNSSVVSSSNTDSAECLSGTSTDGLTDHGINDQDINISRRHSTSCTVNPTSPDSSLVTPSESTPDKNSANPCTDPSYKHHMSCGGFEIPDVRSIAIVTNCVDGNV